MATAATDSNLTHTLMSLIVTDMEDLGAEDVVGSWLIPSTDERHGRQVTARTLQRGRSPRPKYRCNQHPSAQFSAVSPEIGQVLDKGRLQGRLEAWRRGGLGSACSRV